MFILGKSLFLRKFAAMALCALLLGAAGCKNAPEEAEVSSEPEIISSEAESSSEPEKLSYLNPLTGLYGEKDITNNRPVAVMINNIKVAQNVQCGINDADIVYETEVEGGITRLMAVYQDISSVDRIGTVRSARYPYVDMAMGHDAVYIHCGSDPNYCRPHLNDLDHIDVDTGVFYALLFFLRLFAKIIKNIIAATATSAAAMPIITGIQLTVTVPSLPLLTTFFTTFFFFLTC